ncbi:ribonuclease HI [Halococcoides cellulosivorans]|uniref:Ribonuclease H n=1 Tax=Halococcoides cellulosivorans TaxID=1679096 RepID=A0A2R4WYW9_9EURY|nr:ribonuclease HI [Halococcoides cellulosivorans]AWB26732.1 ribonuclease H [Halococcoides cellulosivorans]
MPVIECDPSAARDRLVEAGVSVEEGNTDHERWRARHAGGTAVAYDEKVVLQGDSARLRGLLSDGGGRAHVYFDGACRGNPGPAAIGFVVVAAEDGIVAEGSERIGRATNNVAEYEALIRALEVAADHGFGAVVVRGDSELIVKQVTGAYDTNDPDLRERRIRVRQLLENFEEFDIEHVPRELNDRADELANDAFEN